MMLRSLAYALLVFAIGAPLSAQDWRERAQETLDRIDGVSGLVSEDSVSDTLGPLADETPDEAGLSADEIDDAVFLERVSDSDASRAYSSQVDSALGRPEVTMDGDALSLADGAVANADAIAGGLFAEGGEHCATGFDVEPRDETLYCTSVAQRALQSCREERVITADRDDTWRCQTEQTDYKKRCTRDIAWRCTGAQGSSCMHNAVTSNAAMTWVTPGAAFEMSFAPESGAGCSLHQSSFTVTAQSAAQVNSLLLSDLRFSGAAQVRVNGVNLWTTGGGTGDLRIGERDCGKSCSRDAAYAGSSWIEDCGATSRSVDPNVDLTNASPMTDIGFSTLVDHLPTMTHAPDTTWTIQILRINTADTGIDLGVSVQGACCTQMTVEDGGAC